MIQIERQVQVSYRHRVLFTKGVFEASNPVLRDILLEGFKSDPVKVLVIADDGLVRAYPELSGQIHRYFDQYSDIDLVCPAIIAEGAFAYVPLSQGRTPSRGGLVRGLAAFPGAACPFQNTSCS